MAGSSRMTGCARAEGERIPAGAKLLLPLDRLTAEGAALAEAGHALGVEVSNDTDLALLDPWMRPLAAGRGAVSEILGRPGLFHGGAAAAPRLSRANCAPAGISSPTNMRWPRAAASTRSRFPRPRPLRQPEAHWIEAERAMSLAYQRGYGGVRNILSARWASAT